MIKRVTLFLLILLASLFISCELLLEKPAKPKIHALVIALDYDGLSQDNLYGTINDAEEFTIALNQLAQQFHMEISTTLMFHKSGEMSTGDRYPTKENIRVKLVEFAEDADIQENDIFLLMYTGHGGEFDQPMVVASAPGSSNYLIINTTEIAEWIQPIAAKKLVILDSCYSGQVIQDYPRSFADREEMAYDPHASYLTAASENQLSWEREVPSVGHNHGYFSSYFLKAIGWNQSSAENTTMNIDGRSISVEGELASLKDIPAFFEGKLTVGNIYRYVSDSFRFTENWISLQTPQTGKGPLDMILFSDRW